jgi:radical SAM PhpK family P-methyltransferase
MSRERLDCLIVGHNEGNFSEYLASRKRMEKASGAYNDALMNSVLYESKRITYMDLFNEVQRSRNPHHSQLAVFDPPGLGPCYLTSFLRKREFSVEMIGAFQPNKELFAQLLEEKPLSVAITTAFYFEKTPVKEIVDFVKTRSPETQIILGGPYVGAIHRESGYPVLNETLLDIGADIGVIESQGELTLSKVLKALRDGTSLEGIPNIVFRSKSGERKMEHTPLDEEDNSINENVIDWEQFDPALIQPFVLARTAISCPFACSFCTYPIRAGEHRLASVERVEAELKVLERMGVKYVDFIDDTFNVPVPRFKELCRMMIRNKFKLRWISYLRCGNMDEEAVKLAAESGCVGALLGIESGDAGVLKNMNKFADPVKYRQAIRWLEDAGIMTWTLFIVGFPGETDATVRNTMSLIQDTDPTFFLTQSWFCDVTTPIYRRAQEFGLKGAGYVWRHNTMDWKQAAHWVRVMLHEIKGSTYVPQTGFSFEVVFYLMGKGFDLKDIKKFLRYANGLTLQSLDAPAGAVGGTRADFAKLWSSDHRQPASLVATSP